MKALELYSLAAAQEDVDGQYLMGNMYVEGLGVDQDIELGKEWLKKSADQGNAVAQERLSNLINR